jgi:hypothetical protein
MLPPDGHLVHEAENGLQWRSEDTPRKPEYGDRVPQIGDTVAVTLNDENGTIIVGSLVATYDDKFWIEGDDFDLQVPHQGSRITVIEPARPVVPETYYGVKIPEVVRNLWGTDCKEVRWWTAGVVAMQKINAMGEHIDAKFERGQVIGG